MKLELRIIPSGILKKPQFVCLFVCFSLFGLESQGVSQSLFAVSEVRETSQLRHFQ